MVFFQLWRRLADFWPVGESFVSSERSAAKLFASKWPEQKVRNEKVGTKKSEQKGRNKKFGRRGGEPSVRRWLAVGSPSAKNAQITPFAFLSSISAIKAR
jgi:hypothetical protein